jgi:hypothetical protein
MIENAFRYYCTAAATSGERPGAALMGSRSLFLRENGLLRQAFGPPGLGWVYRTNLPR